MELEGKTHLLSAGFDHPLHSSVPPNYGLSALGPVPQLSTTMTLQTFLTSADRKESLPMMPCIERGNKGYVAKPNCFFKEGGHAFFGEGNAQNSKKETVRLVVKRVAAFGHKTLLWVPIFAIRENDIDAGLKLRDERCKLVPWPERTSVCGEGV